MSGRDPLSGTTPVTAAGVPYPLATIDYYIVGTTTRENTYTTAALSVANSNPVVLGADGRIPEIFFSQQRMKRVFKDSTGATIAGLSWDGIDKTVERIKAAAAPSPTYPGLQWHDTTTGKLWERNAADSGWNDRGPIDSFNAATVTDQLAGTSTSLSSTPDSVAALWQRGADLASAATISLPAGGGFSFNITGTTGITAIGSAQGGRRLEFRFAASLQITHNVTSLICPGGVNIQTSAGDIVELTNDAATDVTGSNWRVTKVQYANGAQVSMPVLASKTGNYTVTDADRGGSVRFAGLSADATLTLPAASGRAGFVLYVSNEDTTDTAPFGMIIDPNGAELIDGFATRKGYVGTRITILCDGTGWRTVSGNWRYFSGNQTITTASTLTLAHNLGVRPKLVWGELRCTTADNGYSVGDTIPMPLWGDNSNVTSQSAPNYDATNINVVMSSAAQVFWTLSKGTRNQSNLTNASWALRMWATD